MNKISSISLIFIIIGLSLPYKAFSQPDSQDAPVEMTTSEPIVTVQNAVNNCSSYDSCEDCFKASCYWLGCGDEQYCDVEPMETCKVLECSNVTTIAPNTTTISPNDTTPTTTDETTTVTTEIPTTTDNTTTSTSTTTTTTPNTTTTTPSTTTTPNATTTSTPKSTTITPIPTSTTTEAPHQRHFDAGSFVGGMILALTLTAVSFAGWKFYRRRALSTSYTNL
ncbi:Sialomucin core protein 24 [Armadillidium vulgare]|nr:Sialomucin core protein 24 [Armadillidium vulgare]